MGKSAAVPEVNGATSNGFIKYEPMEFLFEYAKNTAVYSKVVKTSPILLASETFLLSIHRDSAKWSFFLRCSNLILIRHIRIKCICCTNTVKRIHDKSNIGSSGTIISFRIFFRRHVIKIPKLKEPLLF